jgi:hypothetical protein
MERERERGGRETERGERERERERDLKFSKERCWRFHCFRILCRAD